MDVMWHAFHLDVVSFVVNQKLIDVFNFYVHLKDFLLVYVFEISSDVFEFTYKESCMYSAWK
jgi:hypothetical protein